MMPGLLLVAGWLAAVPPVSPTPSVTPSPMPAVNEYQVGVGDVLEVVVLGNDDLSRTAPVQTNGTLTLPLLGEVAVAGLTAPEIRRKLTTLLDRDYVVKPQVEVKIKEYQSQFVLIMGEVNLPGRKALRGVTTLFDLLSECGGFTGRASGEVTITRSEGAFAEGVRALRLRLGTSMTPQDQVNLRVTLKNGDVIVALPKYFVIVEGEVNRPNRYSIDDSLTITGAINMAGGLTRFGSNTVQLRRVGPDTGKPEIRKVDLKMIRKGKAPDVLLQANDVVTVPRRFF